jgi:hypothetical protein
MASQEGSCRNKSVVQVNDLPFLPINKHLKNIIIRKQQNKLRLRDNQYKGFPDKKRISVATRVEQLISPNRKQNLKNQIISNH